MIITALEINLLIVHKDEISPALEFDLLIVQKDEISLALEIGLPMLLLSFCYRLVHCVYEF